MGAGRAGRSLARALADAGCPVELLHHDDAAVAGAAARTGDVVLLCVPDAAVAAVADALPAGGAVVAHVAGSLGLDVLAPHRRRASLHPVVALPSEEVGAVRLRGAWFAVAGSDDGALAAVDALVAELGGHGVVVGDDRRALHHAAAAVASNHLVALLGQVERLARAAGVPPVAYLDLARGALDDAVALGAADALTGPVARGDWDTVRRHLAALPDDERPAYRALAAAAARLAGREVPPGLL